MLYKVYKGEYIENIRKTLESAINSAERHCFKANIRCGYTLIIASEELIMLSTFERVKNGQKIATYEFQDIDDAIQKLADLGVDLNTIRSGWE